MSGSTLNLAMGCVMILCIMSEGSVAVVVSAHLFGPDRSKYQLPAYLEPNALMRYSPQHVCVCIVSFLEPRLLVFLPWMMSSFSKRSNGFPNLTFFKLIIYVKGIFSTLRVVALVIAHHSTTSTRASIYFSIIVLGFSIGEGLVKLKSEKIQQYDTAVVSKAKLREMESDFDLESGMDKEYLEKAAKELQERNELLKEEIEALRIANRRNSTREKDLEDLEDVEEVHIAKTKYADENLDVVRAQVMALGGSPLEYIPLSEIEAELAELTSKVNSGESFDEKRLDHLLACMERNPEYLTKLEEKRQKEREMLAPILEQHLATMREFIPPNIFDCKMTTLQEDYGYSKALAKRLISKKCIWLVRMRSEDIMKLHEVELTGQYGHGGQVLDVVEKTALFAALPKHFENDGRGVKKKYLLDLEENVKDMIRKAEAGSLSKQLLRHSAYTNQVGIFGANAEMHSPDVTSGEDAFNPRTSYKLASPRSTDISLLSDDSVLLGQNYSVDGSDFSPRTTPTHNGSSSARIGENEFLKRSSSLEQMFRSKSPRGSTIQRKDSEASIGGREFEKRSSNVEKLFLKKSSSLSPRFNDPANIGENEFVKRSSSLETLMRKKSSNTTSSLALVKSEDTFESNPVYL